MDAPRITTIDSLFEHLGNCGLFQILIVIFLHGAIIASPWSMVFMAYGNYNPGWTCADPDLNYTTIFKGDTYVDRNSSLDLGTESSCDVFNQCKNGVFNDDATTIVTEWSLACDRKWISSIIISLQMGGVLVGSLLAGHLNLHIGRKRTYYGTFIVHATLNLITSFSVNWYMFAILRFFIGVTCGSIMLCGFVYPMEFITNRWRGVVAALPFSSTGSLTFTLMAMLLKNWRHLHIATAILTIIVCLPAFWVPDSMRWLAVKGKNSKAVKVGLQIAKFNRKPPASMEVIDEIAERERKIEESKPNFTFLDLYRHGLLQITLTITFTWFTNTIIYYAFIYDVQSLSGNFFINLMLFSAVTVINLPLVPLLTNTIGRKWGIILLLGLAFVFCVILVIMNFVTIQFMDKGLAKLIIVLMINIFIDADWAIVQLYCIELYPTVLRSLSFSHGSSVARIGGMIAPFLIPRDESTAYISQLIMLVLIAIACFCLFLLPETKGQHLQESVTLKRKGNEEELLEMMA